MKLRALWNIWNLAFGKPQDAPELHMPSQKRATADRINLVADENARRSEAIVKAARDTLDLMGETMECNKRGWT